MPDTLESGITVREHCEKLVTGAQALLLGVLRVIRTEKRIPRARRERLRRDLAGVVADCETVRVWLDAGAPDGEWPVAAASAPLKEEDVPLPFDPAVGYLKEKMKVQRVDDALPEPPVSWS